MKTKARILVIDDEEDMLRGCGKIIEAQGGKAVLLSNPQKAKNILEEENIDIVFTDLLMPEIDGLQILEMVQKYDAFIPVVIFSAYGTIDRAVSAMKLGAFDFIEKPFDAEQINMVTEKALRHRNLFLERNNLLMQLEEKFKFDNLIGCSSQMRKVFEMVESVADSEANILITGESGTGKELIARSIHAHSKRKLKPFVPVNCGAFPENLFEAEIFGYEKGAFTGANKKKIGLLEFANGGTFFMDEVCELPLQLQSKLLRTIQDKQLRHVGGNELIQVDIRLISATNENIQTALASQKLREDLYYRLNVVNIHLPPLRERKGDIRLIAEHFLKSYTTSYQKTITGFNEEVLDLFELYSWPGNVRELQNVIERAVALAKEEKISKHELPPHLHDAQENSFLFNGLNLSDVKQKVVEDIEKKYLLFLLKKYKGNVTKAALEAGMTRRNIHRLLKSYNINTNNFRK